MRELYIPGVSALLNGIEASVRVTMTQIAEDYEGKLVLSRYQVLSNTLLRKARDAGLPVQDLAFPGEHNFNDALERSEMNVEVVQLRHDVCHGNILGFIQRMEFEEMEILTPECIRETAAILLAISYEWARPPEQSRDAFPRHRAAPTGSLPRSWRRSSPRDTPAAKRAQMAKRKIKEVESTPISATC